MASQLRAAAAGLVRGADAVVLDCDGVLVGVSASYGRAVAMTVGRLLGELGISARLDVDGALIEGFKASGGFNDEVDLAYAAVLCAAAADASGRDARGLAAGDSPRAALWGRNGAPGRGARGGGKEQGGILQAPPRVPAGHGDWLAPPTGGFARWGQGPPCPCAPRMKARPWAAARDANDRFFLEPGPGECRDLDLGMPLGAKSGQIVRHA